MHTDDLWLNFLSLKERLEDSSLPLPRENKGVLNVNNNSFFDDDFGFGLIGSLSIPFNLEEFENDSKHNKTYFYSKSSSTKGELDKDRNMIYKTKEFTNNNGKKDERSFENTINKDNLKKESKKIKPITFII